MHLAAGIWSDGKDMRIDKSIKIDIETLNKNKVSKSLRYQYNWKKIKYLKNGSTDSIEIFM